MSKHNHYFKDVSQLSVIDVYRTLILFGVNDPCIQHAVKKLLVAGGRGAGKDISQDIQEAIDSLERWKQMREEENPIYNRRSEDNISLVGFPEVKYEDTYQDEPSEQPSENLYNTTGKFKEGDKVRIFNVTDISIPKEFEGAEGIVVRQSEYDYQVKFDKEYGGDARPVWCVWEFQMQLVEDTAVKFKVGDTVLINSHEAGKQILGEEKGVGTHGKVIAANEHCVDVEVIHKGKSDLAFYYPKELTLVR